MGYHVLANREKVRYGVKSFVVDTLDDIKQLPNTAAGSTVYCIETQKKYIMDTQGYWRVAKNMGGGNSGLGDLDGVDLVFDGTEITEGGDGTFDDVNTSYIWDGGVVTPNANTNVDYVWDGGNP